METDLCPSKPEHGSVAVVKKIDNDRLEITFKQQGPGKVHQIGVPVILPKGVENFSAFLSMFGLRSSGLITDGVYALEAIT